VFAENPNRSLRRDWLLEVTARPDAAAFDPSINLRITRMRRKMEIDPAHPEAIRIVREVGYMFVPSKDSSRLRAQGARGGDGSLCALVP
jgi:two-component system phosphate regulon response regulator OmpR